MKKKYWNILIITIILAANLLGSSVFAQEESDSSSDPLAPVADIYIFLPTLFKVGSPVQARTIVADHTAIGKFDSIPSSALAAAAAIKTLFMHQSTGNNVKSIGLDCLAGLKDPNYIPVEECTSYNINPPYIPYDNRNWDWPEWPTTMADAIAKTDQWVSVVPSQQQNYQVLGMKLCYVDGWNLDFDYYRQNMEALERAYPQKKFIWTTTVLWSESGARDNPVSAENIHLFNQQLRAYAIANNKILYDMADIESHDSDGNPCLFNGYEVLCEEYADGYWGGGGGHPDVEGSIRLAKGFWWLMSRISGWEGN
jgi:hypothetical protein